MVLEEHIHIQDHPPPPPPNDTSKTSSFKLGSFTKALLAKAQTDDSGFSPGALQSLVNPLRSHLGLPRLSLFAEPEESTLTADLSQPQLLPSTTTDLSQPLVSIDSNNTAPSNTSISSTADLANSSANILNKSFYENDKKSIAAIIPTPAKHKIQKKQAPIGKKPVWKFSSEHVQGKEYLVIKQLGRGGCGEVVLVLEKEPTELFALKRVNLSGIDDASVAECVNEVQMLKDLRDSDLVVHIYAWELDKANKTMKILMEHGQCDLSWSIKNNNWSCLKLRSIWERLLTIVDLIHRRGIVHADLKPSNFIFIGDNLKIIDFGIASKLKQDQTSIAIFSPKGTLNFISPETLQPDSAGVGKISPKSDIYSLGIILYLMVYGKTPFEHITHQFQKMSAILHGNIEYPPLPPSLISSGPEIHSVLKLCLQMDYRKRPSCGELLHHLFLK